MSKIIDKIIEPSRIEVGSIFKLKIKVERILSYQLVTEFNEDIILENGDFLMTEGDYYE